MSTENETPKQVTCRSCGYTGLIDTYHPCLSVYADCRCPECGSTNNQHNSDYNETLQRAWAKVTGKEPK